MLGVLLFTAV